MHIVYVSMASSIQITNDKNKNVYNKETVLEPAAKKKFAADFYLCLCGTESVLQWMKQATVVAAAWVCDPNGTHTYNTERKQNTIT